MRMKECMEEGVRRIQEESRGGRRDDFPRDVVGCYLVDRVKRVLDDAAVADTGPGPAHGQLHCLLEREKQMEDMVEEEEEEVEEEEEGPKMFR
jgi:hypothetical protein